MIKNIIFDLVNVLVEYDALEYINNLGYDEETCIKLYKAICDDEIWNDLDLGYYEHEIDCINRFISNEPSLKNEIEDFFHRDWETIYTPIEDTVQLLYELKKDYNIYLLSNLTKDGFNYIKENNSFAKDCNGYVISYDVHKVKPDKDIYTILLNTYHLNPKECIFIDDTKVNIEAANTLGIHGIVFKDIKQVRKDIDEATKKSQ